MLMTLSAELCLQQMTVCQYIRGVLLSIVWHAILPDVFGSLALFYVV